MSADPRVVSLLAGITGHETYAYGQGSYDGDACRACAWQGPPGSAGSHQAETKHAAIEAVLEKYERQVRADSLTETARVWLTSEPSRSTYAHVRFFARELDVRAAAIRGGRA